MSDLRPTPASPPLADRPARLRQIVGLPLWIAALAVICAAMFPEYPWVAPVAFMVCGGAILTVVACALLFRRGRARDAYRLSRSLALAGALVLGALSIALGTLEGVRITREGDALGGFVTAALPVVIVFGVAGWLWRDSAGRKRRPGS